MDIRSLKQDAYNEIAKDRAQVLEKNRGYGIISLTVGGITYAIPLRSNLNHSNGFKTIPIKKGKQLFWNGLDYSKALVVKQEDIDTTTFRLRNQKEFDKIQVHKEKITSEFEEYVSSYIECVGKGTSTTDNRFKFCTLQYFHSELGLP
ncbi:hypothetical protein GCM10025882_31930 [Acinetobacter gyllenbergii]|uniref:Uncharacterized protein n=1 Tax=Acinetobacter gyllenbergii CIP 110306 = MTCC 11365 TaxID=1217657 RepID=A0A829HCC0_9GAMM|nr:hypothetical protein [Acinetobacter gyllenbergii]EPF72567.1 hypothetical protein F957_03703 [Acinetobacter gyllenbergii CIP 110306 = MTCC 11365]GMA12768.1 hypothetical protein GCM10025882_31930 [Acinetobacter gyllenbergii]